MKFSEALKEYLDLKDIIDNPKKYNGFYVMRYGNAEERFRKLIALENRMDAMIKTIESRTNES